MSAAASKAAVAPARHRRVGAGRREPLTVLYDRDCGLCAATARTLRRWDRDGRLAVVAFQDVAAETPDEVARLASGRPIAAALHAVDAQTGEVSSGGQAVLEIVGRLPGGSRPAALVATVPPARWAVGVGYAIVARNRHRIGRWLRLEGPDCDVPR